MFYVQCSWIRPNRLCYVCQLFGVVHGIAFLKLLFARQTRNNIYYRYKVCISTDIFTKVNYFRQNYQYNHFQAKILSITCDFCLFSKKKYIYIFFFFLLILTNFSSSGSVWLESDHIKLQSNKTCMCILTWYTSLNLVKECFYLKITVMLMIFF